MIVIVSGLYSIFLGTLNTKLFLVGPSPTAPGTIEVTPLIRKSNVARVVLLLALFLSDWICFVIVFGTDSVFRPDYLPSSGIFILIMHVPVLMSLSYATLAAVGDRETGYMGFGLYHAFSLLVEAIWIISVVALASGDSLNGPVAALMGVALIYFLIRAILCGVSVFRFYKQFPVYLGFLAAISIILKPSLLFIVHRIAGSFSAIQNAAQ